VSRPEAVRRPVAKAAASNRRSFLILCLAVAFACLGFAGWRGAHDPRFAAQVGEVSGLVHETRGDVIAAADLDPQVNAWLIDRQAVAQRIEALPWIRQAQVAVAWPNIVTISVVERTPVARVDLVADRREGSPPAFAVIDEVCRVLAVTTDPAQHADLPRISVTPSPDGGAEPGQNLDRGDVTRALAALRELQGLGLLVSAVSIAPSTGIGATADRNLRVLFGDDDDLARKAALFLAIAAKISTPERIAYVDVRSVRAPTVLYR
jgi:cell division protein FtsQ